MMLKLGIFLRGYTYGGAQVSTLESLKALKKYFMEDIEIFVWYHPNCDVHFLKDVEKIVGRENVKPIPLKGKILLSEKTVYDNVQIPIGVKNTLRKIDLLWIPEEFFQIAFTLKETKELKEIPLITHMRCHFLSCPQWSKFYGKMKQCMYFCSLPRYILCKMQERKRLEKKITPQWVMGKIHDFLEYKLIKESLIDKTETFIFISEFLRDYTLKYTPELEFKHKVVIYNPVFSPYEAYASRKDHVNQFILVYPSGSKIEKGPHIALGGFIYAVTKLELWRRFSTVTLFMLGCKKDSELTRNIKNIKGIPHNVKIRFEPYVPHKEFLKLISIANAILYPSLWPEPFGRVPVEATLVGTPTIASNIGGIKEATLDGKAAILTSPGNVREVGEAIIKLADGEIKFNMEKIRKEAEERFSPKTFVENFKKVLERVGF